MGFNMKELLKKIKDFLSYKKNRKIVIVSLIGIVTVVGITLGITFAPASSLSDSKKSSSSSDGLNVTASTDSVNGTEQFQNSDQENVNSIASNESANADNTSGKKSELNSAASLDINSHNEKGDMALDNGGGNAESFIWGDAKAPATVDCTIAIDCSSISGNGALTIAGYPELEPYAANPAILGTRNITAYDTNGDGRVGVDEALKQACDSNGIQYEFKGSSYVRGINYLYEFNAGPNSGWMYKVNGRKPNKGCNSYYLSGGEDILWYYVISY